MEKSKEENKDKVAKKVEASKTAPVSKEKKAKNVKTKHKIESPR